jgi:hypothetical protein
MRCGVDDVLRKAMPFAHWRMSASLRIVLQKSKVAAVQIFGENPKRQEVDDSYSLSRATEVAREFGARR